jgi:hypothetical protein
VDETLTPADWVYDQVQDMWIREKTQTAIEGSMVRRLHPQARLRTAAGEAHREEHELRGSGTGMEPEDPE